MTEAPLWRLRNAHYLNIINADGSANEWEHKEVSRESGRSVRKIFTVPALLDPETIVFRLDEETTVPRSPRGEEYIQFLGDPTPEMEPLNDAAEAISASLAKRWEHPIDTLPVNGGMSTEEQVFMQKMMATFANTTGETNQSVSKVEYDALRADLDALKASIASSASQIPVETSPTIRR